MNALTGMEKFSHLEDKIYLTIEYAKRLRDEKERLEKEAAELRREATLALTQKQAAEERLNEYFKEREAIQSRIEKMLLAIADMDPETATALAR